MDRIGPRRDEAIHEPLPRGFAGARGRRPRPRTRAVDAAIEIAERARSASLLDFGAGPLLFYSVFICLSRGDLSRTHQLLAETLAQTGSTAACGSSSRSCRSAGSWRSPPAAGCCHIARRGGAGDRRRARLRERQGSSARVKARVAALQGREDECRQCVEAALRHAIANGIGWATTIARLALAELELGLGMRTRRSSTSSSSTRPCSRRRPCSPRRTWWTRRCGRRARTGRGSA